MTQTTAPNPGAQSSAAAVPHLRLIDIGKTIAARHRVPLDTIRSKTKLRQVVRARQEYWVALQDAGLSLTRAGQITGGHDHTTVLYGVRQHRARGAA
jgi:chromosomal replication initiation ATPase DnaA